MNQSHILVIIDDHLLCASFWRRREDEDHQVTVMSVVWKV